MGLLINKVFKTISHKIFRLLMHIIKSQVSDLVVTIIYLL